MLKACIRRDLDAWSAFIRKHSCLISRAIGSRLRKYGLWLPEADIDDIRQAVLTAIWQDRKLETVSHAATVGYWLAVVSGNYAIEYVRNSPLHRNVPLTLATEAQDEALAGLAPAAVSPADELSRQELRDRVDEAMRSLPTRERLVIQLYILHGKRYEEIAGMMRIPAGTVASCVRRGKERLRAALADYLKGDPS